MIRLEADVKLYNGWIRQPHLKSPTKLSQNVKQTLFACLAIVHSIT